MPSETIAINAREYRLPVRPIVAITIDGCDPSYLDDALSRGLLNVSDARSALASIGVDAGAIDLLLSFQRKTLSAADIQAALLRGLLSADQARQRLLESGYNVEAGLVSRPEAANLLGQRGFTGEEAETLLAVTDRKVARTGRRAPAAPQPPAAP